MHKGNFTEGSIPQILIRFSIPFLISNLIQSLYNIADIAILSRFCGTDGITGASIGGNLTQTITFMIVGLCNGGAIMTAQYLGAKKEKDVKETIGTTFTLMFLLSVILTVGMLVFSRPLLHILNTPAEAFEKTEIYLNICVLGSVFIFGYNSVSSILTGMGDSRTPMYLGAASCLLNIVLDVIMVGGLQMDVAGAALATVISQAVSLISGIIYLKHREFPFDFRLSSFKMQPQKVKQIFMLGLPGAVQSVIVSGGFLFVSSITNSLGMLAASGVSTASKINNFAQMPAVSMEMSIASMVGQNVGAKKYDRARQTMKTGILIGLIVETVMFVIVQAFPLQLMGLLVPDQNIISTALPYLRITALDYLLVALCFPLNGLCNGSGHTLFTMIPSICSSVIFRIPVAYFCVNVLDMGLLGVGLSTPTGTLSAILICAVYYFSNKWCKSPL